MRIEDAGIGRRKDSEGRGAGIEICRDSEAQDSSARLETCREDQGCGECRGVKARGNEGTGKERVNSTEKSV